MSGRRGTASGKKKKGARKKPPDPELERAMAEKIAKAIDDAKDRNKIWKYRELEARYGKFPPNKTLAHLPEKTYKDLIGELRAAESKKRLIKHDIITKMMRIGKDAYLINLQSNAVEAIRLRSLLKPEPVEEDLHRPIVFHTRNESERVEKLLATDLKELFGPPCRKEI